jgi:hypothetical protein
MKADWVVLVIVILLVLDHYLSRVSITIKSTSTITRVLSKKGRNLMRGPSFLKRKQGGEPAGARVEI